MLLPHESPGGIIWVQIDGAGNGAVDVSAFHGRTFSSFEDTAAALKANAEYLQSLIAKSGPAKIEVTFGITAGMVPGPVAGGGRPVFALASGPETSSYKVKIVWEGEDGGT